MNEHEVSECEPADDIIALHASEGRPPGHRS